MTNKNIVIVDDNELFREGLRLIINENSSFDQVLTMSTKSLTENILKKEFTTKNINLIVLNPPEDDKMYAKLIKKIKFYRVMVVTNFISKERIMKAVENGVSAFYKKNISITEFLEALESITATDDFTDIKMAIDIKEAILKDTFEMVEFSESELDVLKLVCDQKSSSEISQILSLSIRTIESRKRNMMIKTNSKNMVGVVVIYIRMQQNTF